MTKYLRVALAVMLLVFTMSSTAHAGKYRDAYTSEDNSGVWTFTAMSDISSVVTATPATITAAESGTTYLIAPPSATIVTMSLPAAAADLVYSFSVGSAVGGAASTMVLDPDGTDSIMYMSAGAGDSLRSTASTGTTITVHGGSGIWYVSGINGTWAVD